MAFDVDIVWRSIGYLPHWREFFSKKNNNLDLTLAIASTIIQIPMIKDSDVYPWLTIFQLARFYRVILVIPRMRPLLLRVFGNMTGIANMVLFLLLTNYIAALLAVQLLRGDLPEDTDMNYGQISLSFLGMYQIFSSENWTDILYDAAASEVPYQQAIIVAIFLCGWFLFANFILLQMFIAVIRENFEVAEEQKRQEQDEAYKRRIQPRVAREEWMERWNPYRFFNSKTDEGALGRGGTISRTKSMLQRVRRSTTHARKASYTSEEDTQAGIIATLKKFFDPAPTTQDVPLVPVRPRQRRPTYPGGEETLELERHLEILSATNPDQIPDDIKFQREQQARKAAFIKAHPTFDKPFWIISQQNPIRRFFQTLVIPSNGERVFGQPTSSVRQAFFQLVIMIVVIGGWIDVLVVALGLKGVDQQPGHNVNQANAIFFVVYNLMGAVVILTLFVSIIIGNFSTRSGMALLTNEQRQWIDLQKLIKRQRPSKRPRTRPQGVFREWCYDRAVRKHGFWSRFMTVFYVFHILVLMSQTFSNSLFTDFLRNSVFLFVTLVYAMDIIIRFSGLGWRSFKANGWNLFDIVVVTGNFATGIPIVFGSTGFAIEQLQKLFLVSIAFKLVQKSDNLNQLFKTSVASLPAIFNLFIFWLTLFVFFAIVFVEVFALTRWDTAENHNQNYSSFGNALLMLAFMSTGEGWNQYMHDYTVEYPRCQNSSSDEPDSDCGSTAWAFFLFIAWNILSMYIFVNMFTGVVVENFSYVFQLSGEMSITREEMRSFKKVWGEFDPDRTGYIPRSKLVAFFSVSKNSAKVPRHRGYSPAHQKLKGVFEVRLYPEELTPRGLVQATKMNHPLIYRSTITGEEIPVPLNMRRLNAILNGVDYAQVKARRQTYNRLLHEARIVAEEPRGISFTNMLLLLAHYKLVNDDEALTVIEGHRRKITTKHVTELMNLDRVRSTLKMVYHRRNYLQIREQLEAERRVRSGVPAIIVEDLPSSPPASTRDIAGSNLNSPRSSIESRWSKDDATDHVWHANAQATSTPAAGAGHERHPSNASMLSADITTSPIAPPRFSQVRSSQDLSSPDRLSRARFSQDLSVSVSRRPSIWGDIIQAAGETRHDELGEVSPTPKE
ncbi:calcium channel protein [Ceratobasidium sp. 392]|nr:calcium channel protein [Ceratobasidium sp. 392]